MNILHAWKQSLSLFMPANFVHFIQDVTKSTFETYKLLCTRLVPGIIMLGMISAGYIFNTFVMPQMFDAENMGPNTPLLFHTLRILKWLLLQLFVYVTYAAARPSLTIKNNTYFLQFWWHFIQLTAIAFVFREFDIIIMVLKTQGTLHSLLGLVYGLILVLYSTILGIWTLFFLDTDGWLVQLWSSFKRALMMMIYNVPIILLCIGIGYLANMEVKELVMRGYRIFGGEALLWLRLLQIFILYPFIASIWANLYHRIRHQHPALYID